MVATLMLMSKSGGDFVGDAGRRCLVATSHDVEDNVDIDNDFDCDVDDEVSDIGDIGDVDGDVGGGAILGGDVNRRHQIT